MYFFLKIILHTIRLYLYNYNLTMKSINLLSELIFATSRSSGKGGQNVNKVETKVEVRWLVANTKLFALPEIERIVQKLQNKINEEGYLIITASTARTQLANKELAIKKLHQLVQAALIVPKKRKPTEVPAAVIAKRLNDKKKNALKKETRKGKDTDLN